MRVFLAVSVAVACLCLIGMVAAFTTAGNADCERDKATIQQLHILLQRGVNGSRDAYARGRITKEQLQRAVDETNFALQTLRIPAC